MESTLRPNRKLRKMALVNGCILAIVNIVMMLLVFYYMPHLMVRMIFVGAQLVIGVALIVYFSLDMRRKMGGYWSFKEAVTGIFIMLFFSAVLTFGYTLLFGNLIDPSYPIKLKEAAIAKANEVMSTMDPNIDQNKINQANADIDAQFDRRFDPTVTDIFQNVCVMAIMYFIVSLIFATILKKEKPIPMFNSGE